MKMFKIKKGEILYISKDKFTNISKMKSRLNYNVWLEAVKNTGFVWLENTKVGKQQMANIQYSKIPEKDEVLKSYDKVTACADYDTKKGVYNLTINYNKSLDVIYIQCQTKYDKLKLIKLLEISDFMGGVLTVGGVKVIDAEFVNNIR